MSGGTLKECAAPPGMAAANGIAAARGSALKIQQASANQASGTSRPVLTDDRPDRRAARPRGFISYLLFFLLLVLAERPDTMKPYRPRRGR